MTELNYSELVQDYYDNLNNNLRNFRGGPGFLETWVHDEDHNRSLLEILDLAHANNISTMTIHLSPEVSQSLNLDWLRRNSSEFGSILLEGADLKFSSTKADYVTDEFAGLSELYAENLKRHAETLRFEGRLESKAGVYSVSEGSAQLALAVDDKGVVREVKHTGFTGNMRALMDAFCAVLINRSLQEGSDHGAIRLETELRDYNKIGRNKGLLTLETADPAFAVPQRLARQLFKAYCDKTHTTPQRNFWRDPVPASWLEISYEDRLKEAQAKVLEGSRLLNLQENVQVIKILNDTRFVLSYTQDPAKPDFGRHMIKLERWLRQQLHFEVELQLESIEDRNKRVERTKRA